MGIEKTGNFRLVAWSRALVTLLLMLSFTASARAADTIDEIITGSVATSPAVPVRPGGSSALKNALSLLGNEKFAEAYNLARGIPNDVERRAVQWAAIYHGRGAIDHQSVLRFQADAPSWASSGLYKTRMEQALVEANTSTQEVITLLGGQMPNTIEAQILLARAYVADGQAERAGRIVKSVWVNNFLELETEAQIHHEFSALLSQEDHWRRAQHLLMHDRARGTERIMMKLSPAQKSLAVARIAVSRKSSNAQTLLNAVDPSMRDHYVFHFANGQLARRQGNNKQAILHLNKATGNFPDSAEFWYERRLIARRALARGATKTAYLAAAGYTDGPEGRVVDANFHAGWIALSYLNDPATARVHFEKQKSLSTLPGSITQSNYWLGRALKALGKQSAANSAFTTAAQFDKLYYGQLARAALGIQAVTIRKMPNWRSVEPFFEQRELVRAVRLLAANGHGDLAEPLVLRLAISLKDPGELLLAARLAQQIGTHDIAIQIADIADKRGVALDLFAFPRDGIPANYKLAEMDKSAVYAITRQESRFDFDAISRSGARGLMQLMPATAKETARKVGLPYSSTRLTSDPAYNALLGSTYLAAQLDRYNGSLILAAAAYNGGAGNVNKWLKAYGDPRSSRTDPTSWVEAIPFAETRKYVQRVMGNYMVYRTRQGDNGVNVMKALRTIPH